MSIVKELCMFLAVRKKYWLWPVFVMMCSILFLSSDPVTPATHVNGASA